MAALDYEKLNFIPTCPLIIYNELFNVIAVYQMKAKMGYI